MKKKTDVPVVRPRLRVMVPLAGGELELIRRALRVYMHSEQEAIHNAATGRDNTHAADVRRQCEPRIIMAGHLMERLMKDPTLEQPDVLPPELVDGGQCVECFEVYVHKKTCSKRKPRELPKYEKEQR